MLSYIAVKSFLPTFLQKIRSFRILYKPARKWYTVCVENKFVKIRARAKVNLALNIDGVSAGMHILDSVLVSIDLFDELEVRFNDGDITVAYFDGVSGKNIPTPDGDTVTRALSYLRGFIPSLGASVKVRKGIPVGGGVGGSSADAAAVIFAAKELYNLGDDVISGAVKVGSDVPAMVYGGALRLRGAGENVVKFDCPQLHFVVANKGGGVSTREAFKEFDRLYPALKYAPSDIPALIAALKSGDIVGAAKNVFNALTLPAVNLCPDINEVLGLICDTNAVARFMTGSGSCCCGLYSSADAARSAVECLRRKGIRAVYAPSCGEGNSIVG